MGVMTRLKPKSYVNDPCWPVQIDRKILAAMGERLCHGYEINAYHETKNYNEDVHKSFNDLLKLAHT